MNNALLRRASAITRSVVPRLPYAIGLDLEPVVNMYGTPNLLACTTSIPVHSVQYLISHAKMD